MRRKMTISKVQGSHELNEGELEILREKIQGEWLVYDYRTGSYEGSGFCVWRDGDDYYYGDMSHCSCYGPVTNLTSSIPYDYEQIKEIAKKYNSKRVMDYIDEDKLSKK